ncbi:hypothetical protein [Limihaloglobus sulfuriphilus]|uniref:hypothetical protein n=1 Tax=Limihaloglobus sulfuriphilus TaxID=1851148 RepID=UPI001649CCD2|nr:hypothetical protein [Limihaloglobus sulfuriphilus]
MVGRPVVKARVTVKSKGGVPATVCDIEHEGDVIVGKDSLVIRFDRSIVVVAVSGYG